MPDTRDEVRKTLREARLARGLSQRGLAATSGISQAHISGIEAGRVDLRVSSLIELSRALGLEVMLVPLKLVPAVQSMSRRTLSASAQGAPEDTRQRPAYRLDQEEDQDA